MKKNIKEQWITAYKYSDGSIRNESFKFQKLKVENQKRTC
jgi:hypothetical protein